MTALEGDLDFFESNETGTSTDREGSANTFDLGINRIIPVGDHVKCGELFFEFRKNFSLVCSFCPKQFSDLELFIHHFMAFHLEAQSEQECKPFECLFLDEKSCPQIGERNECGTNAQETQAFAEYKCNQNPDVAMCELRTPKEYVPNMSSEQADVQKQLENLKENNPIRKRNEYVTEGLLSDMSDDASIKYHCQTCDISFQHKTSYKAHAQKHHNMITKSMKKQIVRETCFVIKAINSIKQKKIEIRRRHFSCPQCNTVCSDNTTLVAHVRSNHGPDALNVLLRKYSCKYCDEQMNDMKDVELHVESQHPGDAKYVCPHCTKTFKSFEGRRTHIYTHTGERPYVCPHCPKRFAVPANLRMHIFMHLKIKNYACRFCNKLFVQSNDRNIHEQRHTGEKPYQCEDCGKQFFTSTLLAYHRRRHENVRVYKCDLCDKSYFTSTSLNEHKERHAGQRSHKCTHCDLAFITRKSLKNHEKSHSHVNKSWNEYELSFEAN